MAVELAGEMGKAGFAVADRALIVIARCETVSLLDREVKGAEIEGPPTRCGQRQGREPNRQVGRRGNEGKQRKDYATASSPINSPKMLLRGVAPPCFLLSLISSLAGPP